MYKETNVSDTKLRCLDCGLPYNQFGLDMVLPDQQWQVICPEDSILCANCISKRASKLGGSVLLSWVDSLNYELAYRKEGDK